MTLHGRVKNGVILPIGVATLAEGTLVEIRPIEESAAELERPADLRHPARSALSDPSARRLRFPVGKAFHRKCDHRAIGALPTSARLPIV
jgi:hypothetical protein